MTTATLNELLRTTLTEVERSTDLDEDDPAILGLKNSLVRSVAELAVKREEVPQSGAVHEAHPVGASTDMQPRVQNIPRRGESPDSPWVFHRGSRS